MNISISQPDSISRQTRRPIQRVRLACIQCRARKVKCDATLPECRRCLADGKICEFQKSRRGGRPRRPAAVGAHSKVNDPPALSEDLFPSIDPWKEQDVINILGRHSSGSEFSASSIPSSADSPIDITTAGVGRYTQGQIDQLLANYFVYFHVAHPCVLPRWSLQVQLVTDATAGEVLLPVLLYIGSIFTHIVDSIPLATAACKAIQSARSRPGMASPYHIQALLLYSIAVYASNEPERGRRLLDEAIDGALSIEMHKAEFASQHSQGDAVIEESWRRTWWSLYITDAHLAGSTHSYPTQTGAAEITAHLPCEEQQYQSGDIPNPATLRSYRMREFCDVEFSSFAHLIGFTMGVNDALATRRIEDLDNAKSIAKKLDTVMTAWCSLLPESKRRIIRHDGSVDELMFKANILMHTYIVDVHRQLSKLKYFAIESISKCVPPPPPESNDSIKDEAHVHTAKILYSTDKLNSLLTLPTRFTEHTPFIICMISLMTIAQLSACRYILQEPQLSLEREKIRLNMGVLKMMGEVWASGHREYRAMGIIAREILNLQDEEIHIPETTPIMPLDALDLNFDFDVDWGCESFANLNALEFTTELVPA
ncbi:C6 transcription factor [Paraphoma chrysanthemicola]|uniref:C6 transcription factor n=1 Tax=Paraphoma chrysanthemicola TaxID=798071 RepID=A0A8K0QXA2_9PLEO|nr:C6 transcription factor [Paraphoma chrysanthemicola]